MRLLAAVLTTMLLAQPVQAGPEAPPDILGPTLHDLGLTEVDLGYRPLGQWNRFPHPNTVPYLMPFFADLFARPLDLYEFARTLGNGVEHWLNPTTLREKPEALYRLGVLLATERRIGGFRGFGANLDPHPATDEPLLDAVRTLYARAGVPFGPSVTFGKAAAAGPRDPALPLRDELGHIPAALHAPLARFILNLLDARAWIDRGLRRVPQELRDAVFDAVPRLPAGTLDGSEYFPAIDDVARLVDEESLWYGCLKTLQATQDARRELAAVPVPADGWPAFDVRVDTPWGTLLFDHTNTAEVQLDDPLLIVRLASPGALHGTVGATGRRRPLSVALLVDGPPAVGCAADDLRTCPGMSVATGILGCGILYAAGDHQTSYQTRDWGLGTGLFGLGALIDEGGDDVYRMRSVGMGAAYFGAGLLLDAAGNDHYVLEESQGEGFGGPNGIGILADRSGDDSYYAEPDPAKAGHADYHSEYKVAASNAQGAGMGRRGDGSDGHAWAGGLGALIDVDGNDQYRGGNFSLGVGYWFGTGVVWDGGGNDSYRSVYYTQASGAHFALGALIDESGDDTHVLEANAGAGLGFGWDVVNALLLDRGNGNDRYEARGDAAGCATKRSNAFLFDEGGDDTYVLDAGARGYSQVDDDDSYTRPGAGVTYPFHIGQVALLLDAGGTDTYLRRQGDGGTVPDPDARDDRSWHRRPRDVTTPAGPNVSVGRDMARGRFGFLDPWPARAPNPPAAR